MGDNYIPDDDDFESDINSGDLDEQINTVDVNNIDEEIEIQDNASELASSPGKNILLILIAGVASLFALYNFVFKKDPSEIEREKTAGIIKSQPISQAVSPTRSLGDIDIDVGAVSTPDIVDFENENTNVPTGYIELPDVPIEDVNDDISLTQWPDFGGTEDAKPIITNTTNDAPKFDPTDFDTSVKKETRDQEPVISIALPSPKVVEPSNKNIPPTVQNNVGFNPQQIAEMESAKRRQPMLMLGAGSSGSNNSSRGGEEFIGENGIERTSADAVNATFIGNTDNMIAQGKMVDVVLETAINTDLEGVLRAIVSRDVYAESGNNILIPKGSRLIGEYSIPSGGSERIVISWGRVIRPDGIDIAIDSPGTDQMGRTGVSGFVDNKYFDIISNSILLSAVSVAGAIFVDSVSDSQAQTSSTTTAADGATTSSSTGTSTDAAVLDSVNNLSDIAQNITGKLINDSPTIIVQQGTKLKVFVNRDLHFPDSVASKVKFVN